LPLIALADFVADYRERKEMAEELRGRVVKVIVKEKCNVVQFWELCKVCAIQMYINFILSYHCVAFNLKHVLGTVKYVYATYQILLYSQKGVLFALLPYSSFIISLEVAILNKRISTSG
jgi:hypothetical protein